MAGDRYEELQLELEQLLVAPRLDRVAAEPAAAVLPPMLGAAVARVRKLARRAAARPGDLTRWHEVRKAAKAVRYGAEALVRRPRRDGGGVAGTLGAGHRRLRRRPGLRRRDAACSRTWRRSTVVEGLPRAPFDALLAHQDAELREALARGRDALATALAHAVRRRSRFGA